MPAEYDVAVVGAGPAGSVAALVLARAGARVALLDKATFPRAKACGDLVGPRGVQLLRDLGIDVDGPAASDMLVRGPGGRLVRLPAFPGRTYPGHAVIAPRSVFDERLWGAAIAAGAEPVRGRLSALSVGEHASVLRYDDAGILRADHVIGADGARSIVGEQAGLVRDDDVLWGFALRAYVAADPQLPLICLRDDAPRRAYPGYAWLFPGVDGVANVGIGAGLLADRAGSRRARADLQGFLAELRHADLLPTGARPERLQGGWLKMGVAGTTPARGRLLLVGDAAGLVNPLQGEGIGPAMASGLLAARAILDAPGAPAWHYRAALRRRFGPYLRVAAPVHATLLRHPAAVSALTRALTSRPVSSLLAGAWSLYWNDLTDGATPRPSLSAARVLGATARPALARTDVARRLAASFGR